MCEKERFLAVSEICSRLGEISKSTLFRRMKELRLLERGYCLRLGRRLLFKEQLITDIQALISEDSLPEGEKDD